MEKKQSCAMSMCCHSSVLLGGHCGQLKLLGVLTSNAELQAGKPECRKDPAGGFTKSDGPVMAERRMQNSHVYL